MNSTARKYIVKNILFVLLLLLLYILQNVPGLFSIYGAKPYLTIQAAIAIAMLEGEFSGGIYGAVAGLLCDIGGLLLFGYNGFLTSVCCIAAGLLVIYLMRCNVYVFIMLETLTLALRGVVEYFFAYGMWNYADTQEIFLNQVLPVIVYSVIAGIPLFFLVRFLHLKFPVSEGEAV